MIVNEVETLSLRVERHQYNALALARYLDNHPKVAWVAYLGLPSHAYHGSARQLLNGFGCMLAFGVKGGRGDIVINALKLHSIMPNSGSVHSFVSI